MEILHLDDDIIALNKPAGLSVLPEGWDKDASFLVRQLEAEFGKIWVVHRLDKVTSGVMVFARNAAAHRNLSMQFENHVVQKIYHAIVNGIPTWQEHVARHSLTSNVGRRHRTVIDDRAGKRSVTLFRRVESFESASLLECVPETGRTHQVRAHAALLGHPLLGDSLYGAPSTSLIARPALHALSLTFTHPVTQVALIYSTPYPADFESAFEALAGSGGEA